MRSWRSATPPRPQPRRSTSPVVSSTLATDRQLLQPEPWPRRGLPAGGRSRRSGRGGRYGRRVLGRGPRRAGPAHRGEAGGRGPGPQAAFVTPATSVHAYRLATRSRAKAGSRRPPHLDRPAAGLGRVTRVLPPPTSGPTSPLGVHRSR